jgi:hypothetical protein
MNQLPDRSSSNTPVPEGEVELPPWPPIPVQGQFEVPPAGQMRAPVPVEYRHSLRQTFDPVVYTSVGRHASRRAGAAASAGMMEYERDADDGTRAKPGYVGRHRGEYVPGHLAPDAMPHIGLHRLASQRPDHVPLMVWVHMDDDQRRRHVLAWWLEPPARTPPDVSAVPRVPVLPDAPTPFYDAVEAALANPRASAGPMAKPEAPSPPGPEPKPVSPAPAASKPPPVPPPRPGTAPGAGVNVKLPPPPAAAGHVVEMPPKSAEGPDAKPPSTPPKVATVAPRQASAAGTGQNADSNKAGSPAKAATVETPTPAPIPGRRLGVMAFVGARAKRTREWFRDPEKGGRRKTLTAMVGALALAATAVGVYFAVRHGGPHPVMGRNPSADSGAVPVTPTHHALPPAATLTLVHGDNPWHDIEAYALQQGVHLRGNPQEHQIVGGIIADNGITWPGARHLPVGQQLVISPYWAREIANLR